MPSLDSCVNDLFEPGNIPATSGQPPDEVTALEPSLDFSKTQNSMYWFLFFGW